MSVKKTINPDPQHVDGLSLADSAATKFGIHGAAPAVQRAGAAQAAVVLTGGIAAAAAAAATAGGATPTAAQVDAGVATAVAPIVVALNKAIADNVLLAALVNELRAALVEKGVIKGAA